MKRKLLISSILIVQALVTNGCSMNPNNGGDTEEGAIAEAEQAVGNGTFDNNNNYSYVGFLFDATHTTGSCSGILITPAWVLTADHCIFGEHYGPACGLAEGTVWDTLTAATDTYAVHFYNDPSPSGTPTFLRFRHTFKSSDPNGPASGLIRTILGRAVDSCSDEDSSIDLALIRLDQRVPLSLVTPKHPRNGPCSPQLEITGTVIGYGPTSGFSSGSDDPRRNYTTSDGWTLNFLTSGNVYTNAYSPSGYDGPLHGDSGGALIDQQTGNLCGVSSRFYPTIDSSGVVGATMAALDSDAAQQFLNEFIFDPAGNFLGECSNGPMALRDVDTDGDLIPDACDPCPDVPEPTEDGMFVEPLILITMAFRMHATLVQRFQIHTMSTPIFKPTRTTMVSGTHAICAHAAMTSRTIPNHRMSDAAAPTLIAVVVYAFRQTLIHPSLAIAALKTTAQVGTVPVVLILTAILSAKHVIHAPELLARHSAIWMAMA